MSHASVSNFIHANWTVKYRSDALDLTTLKKLVEHIHQYAKTKNIILLAAGGYSDHFHSLIKLKSEQRLCDVIKFIKGESSFWLNNIRTTDGIFQCQTGYYAESICKSEVNRVIKYILNQQQHHESRIRNGFNHPPFPLPPYPLPQTPSPDLSPGNYQTRN